MGNKPLRPCRKPGCCVLVSDGYCDKHMPKRSDQRSEDAKAWRRLYKLDIWTRDLRPAQLAAEPFCRECAKIGARVFATEVDHIVPHKGRMDLFTNRSNLQSLCHSCHSRKTMNELKQNAQKKQRGF